MTGRFSPLEAMKRFGCIHRCPVGLHAKALATRVKRVLDVFGLEEMGMIEATWILEVEDFGPFIVAIDARGDKLYHKINRDMATRAQEVCGHFALPGHLDATWCH